MTRPTPEEMEAYLAAALYRRSCPSPDELGEYQLGLLDRNRTAAITRHLSECPHCARELAQLQRFLLDDLAPEAEPSPVEAALERVQVAVGRLVGGARNLLRPPEPAFAPVYAGVRGGGGEPAMYDAEGVQVIASAAADNQTPDRSTLIGLVAGLDPAGFTAYLWRDGALTASEPLDEGGNFVVHGLERGSYELVLSGPGREIYIEELTVQ
jgi:anti-sigma factor RsiW